MSDPTIGSLYPDGVQPGSFEANMLQGARINAAAENARRYGIWAGAAKNYLNSLDLGLISPNPASPKYQAPPPPPFAVVPATDNSGEYTESTTLHVADPINTAGLPDRTLTQAQVAAAQLGGGPVVGVQLGKGSVWYQIGQGDGLDWGDVTPPLETPPGSGVFHTFRKVQGLAGTGWYQQVS